MSAARTALLGLVSALAAAVDPRTVTIDDEPHRLVTPEPTDRDADPTPAVRVRASSLTRVGRSRRDGAVLDLELVATVGSAGPEALELTELMLTALEREARYTVESVAEHPEAWPGLGFRVRMPVGVRLEEPVGPRVREPMRLDVQIARSLPGVVLDAEGQGVPDADVRAALGGGPSRTDSDGRFRVLVADAPRQELVVEVRGATRTIEAATDTAPVVIRWE